MTNLAFAVMLTVLGVQWIRIGQGPWGGSYAWFHVASVVFACCALLEGQARRAVVEVQRTSWPISLGFAVYLVMWISAVGLLDSQFASTQVIVRQLFSFALFIFTAGFLVSRLRDSSGSVLLSLVVVAAITFTVAMMVRALSSGGQNPWWVLTHALQSGRTDELIFGLFKQAFSAGSKDSGLQDLEVRSNLRHGIVAALLCAAFVSQIFIMQTPRLPVIAKCVAFCGLISVLLFTFVSLSRSMILSLALYALTLTGLWFVQRKYLYVVGALSAITVVGILVFSYSRMGAALDARLFSETSAYEGRLSGIQIALEEINRHPLFPAESGAGLPSPHNFLLDAWLGGGIVAAASALIVMAALAMCWVQLACWSATNESWAPWALCAPILGAGIIPMVRFFTAGGGTLHLGEWLSLAVFIGGWHYVRSLSPRYSAKPIRRDALSPKFSHLLR